MGLFDAYVETFLKKGKVVTAQGTCKQIFPVFIYGDG